MEVTESYRVLELEIGASRAAVDAAYCRLVEKWHPDRAAPGGPDAVREAQRMVESINDAYQTLAKISPNSIKPTTRFASRNQTSKSSEPSADPTNAGSSTPSPSGQVATVAPKNKPKLPPLTNGQPTMAHQPAPLPPPSPDTWAARSASPSFAPPPARPTEAPSAKLSAPPPVPLSQPAKPSLPPSSTPNPPKFSAPPASPITNPVPLSSEAPPSSPNSASSPRKLPGLYDSLFPVESPLRRFGPVILVGVVVFILLLGKCAVSSSSSRKITQGPDPKSTGRVIAKSNLANVTVVATRITAPGDATTADFSGTVDQALSGLPPGKYTVIGHVDGWPDVREIAAVEAMGTTNVTLNFKGGSLRLDSDPAGAVVRLGAAVLGHTPLTMPQLPPGECTLSLEYPSWPAVEFKTVIREGVESTGNVRLPHGKLIVETTPPGATVVLGKRVLGRTPMTVEQFPVGTRKLTLQAKDFPAFDISVTLEDRGEVKVHPALGSAFPLLDPPTLLRSVWVVDNPDQIAPPSDGVTGPFQSRNGIVKNINRKRLFEVYMNKRYRFSATIKSYDQASGRIEFAEQQSELSKYRVIAILSNEARNDPDTMAHLTKGVTFVLYGRLTAAEEPRWPSKVITFELFSAEPLP